MKKYIQDLKVVSVEPLSDKHVLIRLTDSKALPPVYPGQFVEVKVENSPATFLRRPISVNFVDRDKNELWLLVAAIGDGTREMARLKPGDSLNCVFPLGNGFTMPQSKDNKVLLVGGGVGVAPLLYLGKLIKDFGAEPVFLLGAKTKRDLLELDYFRQIGRVLVTTEDASEGEKGFVTDHSILRKEKFDMISCCGPTPMMKSVARYAHAHNISCEVSLENKMACGLGACLCCVEDTKQGNLCVCKDGPVFNILNLLWQL